MKAVGYTRLSQESDRSIPSQKEDIRDYCENQSLDLNTIFDDGQHSSGFNDERPEYLKMKKNLMTGETDVVVVRDRQRIGRNFDERMRFILDLREQGVELHTTQEGKIDLDDPISVAVEGIHSATDDQKKREEIKKANQEIKKRQEKGYYQGRPPFGLKFDSEKKFLEPDPEEFETCLKILELREEGKSYPSIAEELGIPQSRAYRVVQKKEVYLEKEKGLTGK